ncbi:MAG: DUF4173 domain-containing protein [Chloroflexi bacterium]|nr:DUF4173 domain-containing protein [Chloroflexota bacterium]MDL1886136.1 DUF4173 domain-containing protein [Anaerolineae bacterium CFX8]
MERRTFAIWAVGIGLVLGILGNVFFYGRVIGLSFPLFTVLSVIAVLAARPAKQPLSRRNLWPLIPLLFFAAMVAVRADGLINLLNILAVLSLGGLTLFYLPLARALDEDSLLEQVGHTLEAGLELPPHAGREARFAWDWLRERRSRRGGAAASVLRGLMFASPVLVVFVFLLGSADVVFADYVNKAWAGLRQLLGLQMMGDAVPRLLFTLFVAALGTGALGYAWFRRERPVRRRYIAVGSAVSEMPPDEETAAELEAKTKPSVKLGMIETGVILGSVVALFAAFVFIQFAYFFGGQQNISIEGLTYAQYARRGFFELVAVSVLTLGLALWLDRVTVRQERREQLIFRGLCVALVALTTVMLVSASQRMLLYEDAFGFTQLRVYTHVFMHWLGVLFIVFLLALFRVRKNVFSLGSLLVIIGYLGTLNLMNVDLYIADRNIARYRAGQELDIAFLNILSVDAAPAIIPLYTETTDNPAVHDWAGQWLVRKLIALDNLREGDGATVFSANLSRESAWAQLDAARDTLPEYDSSSYWWYQGSYYGYEGSYGGDYRSGWDLVPTPAGGR